MGMFINKFEKAIQILFNTRAAGLYIFLFALAIAIVYVVK